MWLFQDMLTWTKDGLGLQHSPVNSAEVYAVSNTSSYPHTSETQTHYYDVLTYGHYMQPVPQGMFMILFLAAFPAHTALNLPQLV